MPHLFKKRANNMASAPCCQNERTFIVEGIGSLDGVERVYVQSQESNYSVVIVVAEKDFGLERRIFEVKLAALDAFPGSLFDFRVFVRRGRNIDDVVTPAGELLYPKTA